MVLADFVRIVLIALFKLRSSVKPYNPVLTKPSVSDLVVLEGAFSTATLEVVPSLLLHSKRFESIYDRKFRASLPRITTTQRDAISSPLEGLEIYNTTTHTKDYFNGTVWKQCATV
jgi:hypothetical protein